MHQFFIDDPLPSSSSSSSLIECRKVKDAICFHPSQSVKPYPFFVQHAPLLFEFGTRAAPAESAQGPVRGHHAVAGDHGGVRISPQGLSHRLAAAAVYRASQVLVGGNATRWNATQRRVDGDLEGGQTAMRGFPRDFGRAQKRRLLRRQRRCRGKNH